MKQSQFIDLKLQFTSMFKMSYHDVMKFLTIIKFFSLGKILLADPYCGWAPNPFLNLVHDAKNGCKEESQWQISGPFLWLGPKSFSCAAGFT